jgi:hypothetical protein
MRDLAQMGSSKKRVSVPPRILPIAVIVIVVVAVLYFVAARINIGGIGGSSSGVTLQEAPKSLTPVKVDGAPVDVSGGVTLSSSSATFKNVSEESATATATRVFGNGSYSLTVSATLPDPVGSKYQVWLVGGGQTLSAGFMDGSKTSWSLTLRDKDKYSTMSEIWITKEITAEDGKPERHILEGSF